MFTKKNKDSEPSPFTDFPTSLTANIYPLLVTIITPLVFRLNPEKGKSILDFTANVTLKAHYDMDGQVLILPIRGSGQARIKISELRTGFSFILPFSSNATTAHIISVVVQQYFIYLFVAILTTL